MDEITSADFGLLRREVRDLRGLVSNMDRRVLRLIEGEPRERVEPQVAAATAAFVAKIRKQLPETALRNLYRNDARIGAVLRAVIQPAMTTVPGWAAELVGSPVGQMLLGARPASAFAALSERSLQVELTSGGPIHIPVRAAAPRVNGSFIGEGQPIPMRRFGLANAPLVPKKMGVISQFTHELAAHSTPSIESVLRQAMAEDTGTALDAVLLDANPSDAIRPAGLLDGATVVPPSSAEPASEAMRKDITNAVAAITPAGGIPDPVALVHSARRVGMLMSITGSFIPVIGTAAVPLSRLVVVDASGLATALSSSAKINVSEMATLHEEDTAPLPIVGGAGTAAAPSRSLWQTASVGIRLLFDASWVTRGTGVVAVVDPVSW